MPRSVEYCILCGGKADPLRLQNGTTPHTNTLCQSEPSGSDGDQIVADDEEEVSWTLSLGVGI